MTPGSTTASGTAADETQRTKRSLRGLWKPVLLLGMVVALMILAPVLNLGEKIAALRNWIEGLGPLAPVAFVVAYVVATVAVLPGTPLTVAAGGLFGPVLGVILVSIGSTVGAALCFLVARYFARDAVARWLSQKEKFRKLDALTERHGAGIVALTRLVPLFPFNLLNFGFGLTRVRFWTYVFWSWLCMLPGTVLYVVGTAAIFKAIQEGRVPWGLVGIVAGVIVALAFVVRSARRKLQAREQSSRP